MKWDIFSGRKREERNSFRDDISALVKMVERFAPRKHKPERHSLYYNYQLLNPYLNPLLALLNLISQKDRLNGDRENFIRELFLKLKDFYDPKLRLSLAEAIEDKNLKKKLGQIFLIFYDKKGITGEEIENCLTELRIDKSSQTNPPI